MRTITECISFPCKVGVFWNASKTDNLFFVCLKGLKEIYSLFYVIIELLFSFIGCGPFHHYTCLTDPQFSGSAFGVAWARLQERWFIKISSDIGLVASDLLFFIVCLFITCLFCLLTIDLKIILIRHKCFYWTQSVVHWTSSSKSVFTMVFVFSRNKNMKNSKRTSEISSKV